jgi:hypothetical protein
VTYSEGLISIDARDVPLERVLKEVGQSAGVSVVLSGELDQRVRVRLNALPLAEAVRRLAADTVLVMIHEPRPAGVAGPDIREIRVYAGSGEPVVVVSGDEAAAVARESEPSSPRTEVRLDGLDRHEQAALVEELLARADEQAVRALQQVLEQAEDKVIRTRVVDGLAGLGEPAVDALAAGLGDEDLGIRERVVEHLGDIGGERAVVSLGQVVFGEHDPEIRRRAVSALARQNTEAAVALLQAAADQDADPLVRTTARQALGRN